ncbi:MAG: hypothetical protein PHQ96_04210, partial [Candidatus Omnitrophica bacterium]|nr:hypothetical protein [Candidatus Omnitrophota bacterium]
KEMFMKLGEFKTCLGRRGKCLLSGEDNEMYNRIFNAGVKIYYNPKQLVYHLVSRKRQKLSWLAKRFFWEGVTQVLLDAKEQRIFQPCRILFDAKSALKNFIKAFYFIIIMKKDKQMKYFLEGMLKLGRVYLECLPKALFL